MIAFILLTIYLIIGLIIIYGVLNSPQIKEVTGKLNGKGYIQLVIALLMLLFFWGLILIVHILQSLLNKTNKVDKYIHLNNFESQVIKKYEWKKIPRLLLS